MKGEEAGGKDEEEFVLDLRKPALAAKRETSPTPELFFLNKFRLI